MGGHFESQNQAPEISLGNDVEVLLNYAELVKTIANVQSRYWRSPQTLTVELICRWTILLRCLRQKCQRALLDRT